MKKILLLGTALLLQMTALAQLQNADFETWELPINGFGGNNRPAGWQRTNGIAGSENYFFYHAPVTAAQNGNYALRLSIWYTYDLDMAIQTAPINYRPASLTGFYTYTDNIVFSHFSGENVEDQATATVRLKKLNAATGETAIVGTGTVVLPASGAFAAFTCPITYTSAEMPDSIEIVFDCSLMDKTLGGSSFTSPESGGVSSILTIDNIALTGEALATVDHSRTSLHLYPNPASEMIYVKSFEGRATIYDSTGKLVFANEGSLDKIDVAALQSGVYILALSNAEGIQTKKFIKK